MERIITQMRSTGPAEACYRRAQTLHPQAPAPLARLAVLLRGKLPETDCDAIRAQLGLAPGGGIFGEKIVDQLDHHAMQARPLVRLVL